MEGKYFIKEINSDLNKHDHVIFTLNNKEELRYNDTRKFGKMHLVKKDELDKRIDSIIKRFDMEFFKNQKILLYRHDLKSKKINF